MIFITTGAKTGHSHVYEVGTELRRPRKYNDEALAVSKGLLLRGVFQAISILRLFAATTWEGVVGFSLFCSDKIGLRHDTRRRDGEKDDVIVHVLTSTLQPGRNGLTWKRGCHDGRRGERWKRSWRSGRVGGANRERAPGKVFRIGTFGLCSRCGMQQTARQVKGGFPSAAGWTSLPRGDGPGSGHPAGREAGGGGEGHGHRGVKARSERSGDRARDGEK